MIPESYKETPFVRCYFENRNWSCDRIAIFENEEEYKEALPILEEIAEKLNYDYVSEAIGDW